MTARVKSADQDNPGLLPSQAAWAPHSTLRVLHGWKATGPEHTSEMAMMRVRWGTQQGDTEALNLMPPRAQDRLMAGAALGGCSTPGPRK